MAQMLLFVAAAEQKLFSPHLPVYSTDARPQVGPVVASVGQAMPAAYSRPLYSQNVQIYAEPMTYAEPMPVEAVSSSTVETLLPWGLAGASIALLVLGGRHARSGSRASQSSIALLSVQG